MKQNSGSDQRAELIRKKNAKIQFGLIRLTLFHTMFYTTLFKNNQI